MKSSILGTLYHCIFFYAQKILNEYTKNFKCLLGEHTWCFCNGAPARNETPGNHNEHITTPINKTVLKFLIPLYHRLTDEELYNKCLKGQTQNSNEFDSNIWRTWTMLEVDQKG